MSRLAKLQISDGTTTIDLLESSGFSLREWRPARAPLKGDGTWASSPLSDGRALVSAQLDNTIETIVLAVAHYGQDQVAALVQNLERLLKGAQEYWVSPYVTTPVYLEARGQNETNSRYAILYSFKLSGENDPYQQPFYAAMGRTAHEELTLILERGHWLSLPPTEDACVMTAAGEIYQSVLRGHPKRDFVGGVWVSVCDGESNPWPLQQESVGVDYILQEGSPYAILQDAAAINYEHADECYITNQHVTSNLTHIYAYDASAGTYSANKVVAALPYAFFPDVGPALADTGDIAYFGIDSIAPNSINFWNLVFHISSAWSFGAGESTAWEYWDGAGWVAFSSYSIQDNTSGAKDISHSFQVNGCNSICWTMPSDMTTTTVNAVSAHWVRCVLTCTAPKTPPTQTVRHVYTTTWPFIEVGEDASGVDTPDVRGDLPALARVIVHNQAGYDNYYPTLSNKPFFNRCMIGLRSMDRGDAFTPYLACNELIGLSAGLFRDLRVYIDNPETTWLFTRSAPTGRCANYVAQAVSTTFTTQLHFVIGAAEAAQWQGRYRCFVRIGTTSYYTQMRLRISSGALDSPLNYVTNPVLLSSVSSYQLADFGIVTLPVGGNNTGSDTSPIFIALEMCSSTIGSYHTYLHDVILLPVDEWFGDFYEDIVDPLGAVNSSSVLSSLDIDSTRNPKKTIEAVLRGAQSEEGKTRYLSTVAGPVILQANTNQRLWFLLSQWMGNSAGFLASPWVTASVRVRKVERYAGMRGAR